MKNIVFSDFIKFEKAKRSSKINWASKFELEIIKVMSDHVHMIIDVPRTMSDAKAL